MGHFQAVSLQFWQAPPPLGRPWLHGWLQPTPQDTAGKPSTSYPADGACLGPDFKAGHPPHAAAIEPAMCCILDGHWPSREWSQTGPAQCVAYTLGQQQLIGGWPLRYMPCCAMPQRGGQLPFVSPQTNHMTWGHYHPPGHRAASPCGVWSCQAISKLSGMPLCSVMQHPCSDDNEGTTRCLVLPRLSCHLCSRCITTSAHSCLHAGAAHRQCTAQASNERYARAAPTARLQPVGCHQREG
jgi:hypothetical protein